MSAGNQSGGGLSAQTLLVASVSSAVAAIVIGQIWRPGAILGAAMTPVIVAVTSELLRRAPEKVTTAVPRARPARGAPAPSEPPEDRFGIWSTLDEPARAPRAEVRRRRALRVAVVTGLVAFVIGAVALTTGELVFGGAVGGGERTTVFGGSERGSRDRDRDEQPATTDGQTRTETVPAPAPDGETVPEATEPAPTTTTPTEPAPGRTTPTVPAPTTPTTPAPGATQTVPPSG